MAFLVDDTTNDLVRNLWPTEFKRFKGDPTTVDDCYTWQAVPTSDVDISEWLQVIPNPAAHDRSRPFTVTHVPDAEDGNEDGAELYEVGIRVHGFLERFNLASTGNWDGKEHSAVKAVQSVVLGSGGYGAQWRATLNALNRVITVVTKMVKPQQEPEQPFDVAAGRPIYMQRRVFTRPCDTSSFNVPLDVTHRARELHAIQHAWHVDGLMEYGLLTRDGSFKRATSIAFRAGHFVELTAYVEIVVNKAGRMRVHLRPERLALISTEGIPKGRSTAPRAVKILKRAAPSAGTTTEDHREGSALGVAPPIVAPIAIRPHPLTVYEEGLASPLRMMRYGLLTPPPEGNEFEGELTEPNGLEHGEPPLDTGRDVTPLQAPLPYVSEYDFTRDDYEDATMLESY